MMKIIMLIVIIMLISIIMCRCNSQQKSSLQKECTEKGGTVWYFNDGAHCLDKNEKEIK